MIILYISNKINITSPKDKIIYTIKDSIKNNKKKISSINKALGQYKIMSQKEIFDFFKNKYLVLFNKNFSGF